MRLYGPVAKNVECGYNCIFSSKSCDFFIVDWSHPQNCYLASYNKTDTGMVLGNSSGYSSYQNLGKYTNLVLLKGTQPK